MSFRLVQQPEEFLNHPIVARLAGMVLSHYHDARPLPNRGGFFFDNKQNNIA